MSLVTPLNRVLGLGTAKGAGEHWWRQRLTAVALVPLGLWFAFSLLTLPDFGRPHPGLPHTPLPKPYAADDD